MDFFMDLFEQSLQSTSSNLAAITKEQFCRICHISKRHAKYLLDSGLVKCVDSGKKTRRYTIQAKDVWTYLIDQDAHPEKYRAPAGYYSAPPVSLNSILIPVNFLNPKSSSLSQTMKRLFSIPCGKAKLQIMPI